ncbi:hypothetical protein [Enterobacter ludwigii]|uniref:hypothetical protein n=1 Tax=Enterobacter ludwigii TaxID=299767 RepID=UPI000AB8BE9F|nr:hypothetical protein [Enterobacter ludwigii]
MCGVILPVIALIAPVLCSAVAGILAYQGKDGWGWFLFAAIVLASGISIKIKG